MSDQTEHDLHPETSALVARFAAAMKDKLAAAEKKYGYSDGWMDVNWKADLIEKIQHHVIKGDPRDVAAYCAFAWHHGWSVTPPDNPCWTAEQIARGVDKALDGGAVSQLGNLLAVIHRDGGHYQDRHGDEKATKDAILRVFDMFRRLEDAENSSQPNVIADELEALECLDLSPAFKGRILAALRTPQPQDEARDLALIEFVLKDQREWPRSHHDPNDIRLAFLAAEKEPR